jgi:hypothetical protein
MPALRGQRDAGVVQGDTAAERRQRFHGYTDLSAAEFHFDGRAVLAGVQFHDAVDLAAVRASDQATLREGWALAAETGDPAGCVRLAGWWCQGAMRTAK